MAHSTPLYPNKKDSNNCYNVRLWVLLRRSMELISYDGNFGKLLWGVYMTPRSGTLSHTSLITFNHRILALII